MPSLSRTLSGGIPLTGGAVLKVFGRAGEIAAVLGDYTSSLVINSSTVAGATVTVALETLKSALDIASAAIATKADSAATTASLSTKASTTDVNASLATKADRIVPSVIYTAAATTLQASDADKNIGIDSSAASTLTVPPNIFPLHQVLIGVQLGVGRVQLLEGAGVSLRSSQGLYTRYQYAPFSLYQRTLNVWELYGDLVSV